jgi:hypothetical protein
LARLICVQGAFRALTCQDGDECVAIFFGHGLKRVTGARSPVAVASPGERGSVFATQHDGDDRCGGVAGAAYAI